MMLTIKLLCGILSLAFFTSFLRDIQVRRWAIKNLGFYGEFAQIGYWKLWVVLAGVVAIATLP